MRIILALLLSASSLFAQADYSTLLLLQSSSAQTASDTFLYTTASNLDDAPNWSISSGSILVASNSLASGIYANASGANSLYYYDSGTWSGNQSAEMTIVNVNGTTVTTGGPAVRVDAANGYYAVYVGGTVFLNKSNSDVHAGISSYVQALAVGNKLRLQATGSGSATRLKVSVDTGSGWTDLASSVDPGGTYISSGNPGVSTYNLQSAPAPACFGLWTATDL